MAGNISLEALIDSYFLFSSYSSFFCENAYRLLAVKGTLMQTWIPSYKFVFIWKQYP